VVNRVFPDFADSQSSLDGDSTSVRLGGGPGEEEASPGLPVAARVVSRL